MTYSTFQTSVMIEEIQLEQTDNGFCAEIGDWGGFGETPQSAIANALLCITASDNRNSTLTINRVSVTMETLLDEYYADKEETVNGFLENIITQTKIKETEDRLLIVSIKLGYEMIRKFGGMRAIAHPEPGFMIIGKDEDVDFLVKNAGYERYSYN